MRKFTSFIAMLSVFMAAHAASASISNRTMMKGESSTIDVEYEIGDVAITDRSVCDYLVSGNRKSIYLNATGGGDAVVTIWNTDGKKRDEFSVRVVTSTLKEVLDRIKSKFGYLSGVRVAISGGKVEINGKVIDPDDFGRIESLARSDPRVKNRVRLANAVIGTISSAIKKAVTVAGVTVRPIRDKIALEGVTYSETDHRRAVSIAKLYYPQILDFIDVKNTGRRAGTGNLIQLEFHMMEIKKSALRGLGVNWAPGSFAGESPSNASAGGSIVSSVADMGKSIIGFVLNLIPKIKFLREKGDGRVLENPSIIVKSGETAQIFSGSEVPYYKGDEVNFKKVGIEINAEPIKTQRGADIKIKATLSSPSADIRGAVDTNTISTTAVCPFGESLILANIVRNGDIKMKNRTPRDIDRSSAIFSLFLSKDFQSNRSEFVIFVTPRLVTGASDTQPMLSQYSDRERSMIADRSKRELKQMDEIKNDNEGKKNKATHRKRHARRRKWR